LLPDWINENNGIWIQDVIKLTDIIADYIQNWLEDNISVELYSNMEVTPNEYSDRTKFDENISNLFQGYFNLRMENFKAELDKHEQTTEQ
jgi:methionine salvage enolase-phosphatase E1